MSLLASAASPSAGVTSALIVKRVGFGSVFALIVTVFVCLFFLPLLLNSTLISPSPPGATGSFGHSGTVQPHEPFALLMINGSSPEISI